MDLVWALALTGHLGFSEDVNGFNPHIRLEQDRYIFGMYYNSLERASFYSGVRLEPTNSTGIEFALVSGYDEFNFVVPYVRMTYDLNNNIRLYTAPGYEKNTNNTTVGVLFGIEYLFK